LGADGRGKDKTAGENKKATIRTGKKALSREGKIGATKEGRAKRKKIGRSTANRPGFKACSVPDPSASGVVVNTGKVRIKKKKGDVGTVAENQKTDRRELQKKIAGRRKGDK